MNKKGFTLIEVILVIAIIALLSLILIPNVINLIDKKKIESCTELENNIISAAKMYVTNNKYQLGFECGFSKDISIKVLKDSGDLKGEVKNPLTGKNIADNTNVTVTYNCDTQEFSYDFKLDCK